MNELELGLLLVGLQTIVIFVFIGVQQFLKYKECLALQNEYMEISATCLACKEDISGTKMEYNIKYQYMIADQIYFGNGKSHFAFNANQKLNIIINPNNPKSSALSLKSCQMNSTKMKETVFISIIATNAGIFCAIIAIVSVLLESQN